MTTLNASVLCMGLHTLASAVEVAATGPGPRSEIRNPEWVRALFDTTEHDFGVVFSEERYTHCFRFRHPEGKAVTVTSVVAGCKCTAAVVRECGKEGKKWGEIEVTMKTQGRSGPMSQRVKVSMLTPEPSELILTLSAFVVRRGIQLEPSRLTLGNISRKGNVTRAVHVETVTSSTPARLTQVRSSAPWIRTLIKEVAVPKDKRRTIAKVRGYELQIQIDGVMARPGSFLEFVTLHTDSSRSPIADLPIKGRILR